MKSLSLLHNCLLAGVTFQHTFFRCSAISPIRLNKAVASASSLSRRKSDKLIADGRITVNRKHAEAGQKVTPFQDMIRLDGKILKGWENYSENQTFTFAKEVNKRKKSKLSDPSKSVILENNHIILVNKPAGFHCQPNETNSEAQKHIESSSSKCLVSKLKQKCLGGGANGTFLLPLHRIDQPCTGAVILAKTSKAGARISKAWRNGKVSKSYFCVVEGSLEEMMKYSQIHGDKFVLKGLLSKKKKSRSVIVKRFSEEILHVDNKRERYCELEWEHLTSADNEFGQYHLIKVKTNSGARHQVRAMLSHLTNSPCAGDLRYGASFSLDDKSVALHSREIFMPTVSLGEIDFSNAFEAPIPLTWSKYFNIKEEDIEGFLKNSRR